jgi:hypothetical protein
MIGGVIAVWFVVAAALVYLDLIVIAALIAGNAVGLLILALLAKA